MLADRHDMTSEEWSLLQQALPGGWRDRRRRDDRRVMNEIFFVLRTGIPWRDLPERYGPYTTCYNRWGKSREWLEILRRLQNLLDGNDDGDGANALLMPMIDSPAVRGHRLAAGSPGRGEPAQLGQSQGGMGSRIRALVDGHGQPTALFLPPGKAAGRTAAETLAGRHRSRHDGHRGQGLRHDRHSRPSRRSRCDGRHSLQEQQHGGADARQRGECDAQSGWAVLREKQGVSASRHPIWQASPRLPARRDSRSDPSPDARSRESDGLSSRPGGLPWNRTLHAGTDHCVGARF